MARLLALASVALFWVQCQAEAPGAKQASQPRPKWGKGKTHGAPSFNNEKAELGVRLFHHSFEGTLTYDDVLDDWLSSGATMAMRERVLLMPPVSDRYAVFWNKRAINTRDYEVTFTLSARRSETAIDGTLAFWISPENYSASFNEKAVVSGSTDWTAALTTAGLSLLANKPQFRGFALAFSGEQITGGSNDGSKSMTTKNLQEMGKPYSVKWAPGIVQAKVRVAPDGSITARTTVLDLAKHLPGTIWGWANDGQHVIHRITFEPDGTLLVGNFQNKGKWVLQSGNRFEVHLPIKGRQSGNELQLHVMRLEGSSRAIQDQPNGQASRGPLMMLSGSKDGRAEDQTEWPVVARLPPGTLPSEQDTYIGFSGYSGSSGNWLEADLNRVEVRNFDMRRMGEEDSDLLGEEDHAEWLRILNEEKRYVSQASQYDAVLRLTEVLQEHKAECEQLGEQIHERLHNLDESLDSFGANMNNYLAAASAWYGGNKGMDHSLATHIKGIRSLLMDDHGMTSKLNTVHSAAKELRAVHNNVNSESKAKTAAEQAQSMQVYASAGSTQRTGLLFLLIVSVAGLGFLFFNRMRYYERKHFI